MLNMLLLITSGPKLFLFLQLQQPHHSIVISTLSESTKWARYGLKPRSGLIRI